MPLALAPSSPKNGVANQLRRTYSNGSLVQPILGSSVIILPMCGRYRLSRRKQIIEEHFDAVSGDEDWNPRYNIAPTEEYSAVYERNIRHA
jgi:hypothetical protein